jgi:hypothetical protein
MKQQKYRIVRQYCDSDHPDHLAIVRTGLNRAEAEEWCERDDTHEMDESSGHVVWMDGFEIDNAFPRRRLGELYELWHQADRKAHAKDRSAERLEDLYPDLAADSYRAAAILWRRTADIARALNDEPAIDDGQSHAEHSDHMARKMDKIHADRMAAMEAANADYEKRMNA